MRPRFPSVSVSVLAFVVSCSVATALPLMQPTAEPEAGSAEPMNAGTFAGLELRSIGPALMSGRVSDLAVHPDDQSTWFVAVGSGGLWKTTNSGTTWNPIFDHEGSYSIGCVTIDPKRPATVWVGTGEDVSGRHVGYGDGVYRSRDAGASWEHLGLEQSEHIGMIVVDPRDSDTVYVAAEGPLWSPGGQRGLFKTVDGGGTWELILSGSEYTGVNELHLDPRDPDVMYAVTHQRFRNVAALINGGPESGIHKSTDGGVTWRELTNGIPAEDKGKIGVAVSPINPDIVYATIELAHRKGGFYRSADGGESWTKGADYISTGTGPHYYQEIFASPHKLDRVYQMDVRLHVTEDGGKTFRSIARPTKHVDNHAIAFDPNDPDYLLVGCDGGLYQSWDLGKTWQYTANLPVTQFYKVDVDYDEPFYNVIGGTQDNATQHGPSRTDNIHGIRNSDWMITVFGDGHEPTIDPTNPDIIYSQWQQGNLVRHDRKTGEIVYIQPQPAEDEETDRFNWDAPILISPHDPKTLFFASQRVWRSNDRGDSWTAISGDLSRGLDRLGQPMMDGRVWSFDAIWDLYAMSKFGTVTSLSQSPQDAELIYAGTDDGLIHVSENGGSTWRRAGELPDVPDFSFVNDIKADLHDADTVYVCLDNHKAGDFEPYVLKSTDRGRTWSSIRGDLPDRHLVWRLVQDHIKPELLFLGTEFGVFFSTDRGERWIELAGGVPNIPFRDLAIQTREDDLVGATFGRGFYILDDYSALREVSKETLSRDAMLFPVRDAWWYVPRRTMGYGRKASQGDGFYVAPNPPFGATFTYYLKEPLRTRKQIRTEREQAVAEQGGDTPTPGWEALRAEELEEDPAVVLTVRDSDGHVVRHISGPTGKGIHRVSWSLTYPSTSPWSADEGPGENERPVGAWDDGMLVAPGTYTVHLATRVDGDLVDTGDYQEFEVTPLHNGGTLPGADPEEFVAFRTDLGALQRDATGARNALDETRRRLGAIRKTLDRSTIEAGDLARAVRELDRRVAAMQERLSGNARRGMANDQGPVSISRRLSVVQLGTGFSLHGPTRTHLESFEIARRALADLKAELHQLATVELPELERRLEEGGLPWTPGRVPSP
ncbi:MAG: glycosyl hydrolase [Planctomycetota bacterium]